MQIELTEAELAIAADALRVYAKLIARHDDLADGLTLAPEPPPGTSWGILKSPEVPGGAKMAWQLMERLAPPAYPAQA